MTIYARTRMNFLPGSCKTCLFLYEHEWPEVNECMATHNVVPGNFLFDGETTSDFYRTIPLEQAKKNLPDWCPLEEDKAGSLPEIKYQPKDKMCTKCSGLLYTPREKRYFCSLQNDRSIDVYYECPDWCPLPTEDTDSKK